MKSGWTSLEHASLNYSNMVCKPQWGGPTRLTAALTATGPACSGMLQCVTGWPSTFGQPWASPTSGRVQQYSRLLPGTPKTHLPLCTRCWLLPPFLLFLSLYLVAKTAFTQTQVTCSLRPLQQRNSKKQNEEWLKTPIIAPRPASLYLYRAEIISGHHPCRTQVLFTAIAEGSFLHAGSHNSSCHSHQPQYWSSWHLYQEHIHQDKHLPA